MDIFKRIEQDHEKQRRLMAELLDTEGDSERRRELFEEFCEEFEAHAAAEEHAFYAEMMKVEDTTEQSRHSVAEHQSAMELVEKLRDTDMSSSAWLTTFKTLADENEHHMKEEEDEVFPLVKDTIPAEVRKRMLTEFNERKSEEQES
ncbi:MAG: hemerythrin domain-containing protein [Granulosicoccus sp.]|nr:hemerythrin domain-containing protein [Granulosicoccus sp.]